MQRQSPLGLATAVLWAEAEGHKRRGRRYNVVRRKHSHKYSYNLRSVHQPLDQGIKCVPTAKGAEPTIRVVVEICRDLWGSHHHTSRSQMPIKLPTCPDQTPPCRSFQPQCRSFQPRLALQDSPYKY
ncbi:unnamed protein product [Prunus brigantina]